MQNSCELLDLRMVWDDLGRLRPGDVRVLFALSLDTYEPDLNGRKSRSLLYCQSTGFAVWPSAVRMTFALPLPINLIAERSNVHLIEPVKRSLDARIENRHTVADRPLPRQSSHSGGP